MARLCLPYTPSLTLGYLVRSTEGESARPIECRDVLHAMVPPTKKLKREPEKEA